MAFNDFLNFFKNFNSPASGAQEEELDPLLNPQPLPDARSIQGLGDLLPYLQEGVGAVSGNIETGLENLLPPDITPPGASAASLPIPGASLVKQIPQAIVGASVAGAGAVGTLSLANELVGPDFESDKKKEERVDMLEKLRLQNVDKGALPGTLADQIKMASIDSQNQREILTPQENESPKDHISRVLNKDSGDSQLLQNLGRQFAEASQTGPGQALTDTLKEMVGVDVRDLADRRGLKTIDEMLDKSNTLLNERMEDRPERTERLRQLRAKLENPEVMSTGEKAAFVLAAAVPLIAAAVTKRKINPQAINSLANMATARENEIRASNQRNLTNVLLSEKALDESDSRLIADFARVAGIGKDRTGLVGLRQQVIGSAIKNVETLSDTDAFGQPVAFDTNPAERKTAGLAIQSDLVNARINRLEEQFEEQFAASNTRLARFKLSDYLPTVGNEVRLQLPNEGIPDELRSLLNAQLEFMTLTLRKESGAAISVGEFVNQEQRFFITPGDDPETIGQKRLLRQRAIDSFRTEAGAGAMAEGRKIFLESLVAPQLKEMGGRIIPVQTPKGTVNMVSIPDGAGGFRVGAVEKLAELLLQNNQFDVDEAKDVEDLIKGF